jgi:hypothetical protein
LNVIAFEKVMMGSAVAVTRLGGGLLRDDV